MPAAAGMEGARPASLDDLDRLRNAAADSDGVIHLAFKHESAFSGNFDVAPAAHPVTSSAPDAS